MVVRVRGDGRASRQGVQRAAQEKVEVCLHLVPGGEDKGARGGHPHDSHHSIKMVNILLDLFLPPLSICSVTLRQVSMLAFTNAKGILSYGPE